MEGLNFDHPWSPASFSFITLITIALFQLWMILSTLWFKFTTLKLAAPKSWVILCLLISYTKLSHLWMKKPWMGTWFSSVVFNYQRDPLGTYTYDIHMICVFSYLVLHIYMFYISIYITIHIYIYIPTYTNACFSKAETRFPSGDDHCLVSRGRPLGGLCKALGSRSSTGWTESQLMADSMMGKDLKIMRNPLDVQVDFLGKPRRAL